MARFVRVSFWVFVGLCATIGVLLGAANWRIEQYSRGRIYDSLHTVPRHRVGLLLGTSPRLSDGSPNPYFKYRIDAAVMLYESGKIEFILVSGDNSLAYYNEPMEMKRALLKRGVPESVIYLDYAGFRTLDSVVRGQKIFGLNEFIIISQPFHNKRAVYIAHCKGINAIGFNARNVGWHYDLRTRIREWFARAWVFVDIYLLDKQPKFLGAPIEIKK